MDVHMRHCYFMTVILLIHFKTCFTKEPKHGGFSNEICSYIQTYLIPVKKTPKECAFGSYLDVQAVMVFWFRQQSSLLSTV